MIALYWLIAFIVLLIIEAITLGLTTIWFAGGALVAAVAAMAGAPLFIQIVLFFAVSLVLLFATRPLAVRYFNKDRVRTNAESLVGTKGIVIEPIDNLKATGLVQVKGQEWSARTAADGVTIEEGAVVTVREIRGVKLIVEERTEVE